MLTPNLYMYHLDYEIDKLFTFQVLNKNDVYHKLDLITRIGILLAEKQIIIPASNYLESQLSFEILNSVGSLSDTNLIRFASSSINWLQLFDKAKIQHQDDIFLSNYHYKDLLNEGQFHPPGSLIKRKRSASLDIQSALLNSIDDCNVWAPIFKMAKYDNISSFEKDIESIPQKLENRAYLSKNITPLLKMKSENLTTADSLINLIITCDYINSFLLEYDASCLVNIPLIDSELLFPITEVKNKPLKYIDYNYFATELATLKYNGTSALDYIKNANNDQLINFKISDEWANIVNNYVSEFSDINEKQRTEGVYMNMRTNNDIKIGIVTALPKEYAAMESLLMDIKKLDFGTNAGERYVSGCITSANQRKHNIALCLLPDIGNNMASIIATKMQMNIPSIDAIIMVGIAGGVDDVHLGDVVVCDKGGVIQYDNVKETENEIEERHPPRPPSAQLIESSKFAQVDAIKGDTTWMKYIDKVVESLSGEDFSRPNSSCDVFHDINGNPIDRLSVNFPSVYYGIIASSNSLQKNPKRRSLLQAKGVKAIEMEASGIADSSWIDGHGYIVIRGICDYCDEYKDNIWQNYASAVAAAYTRHLLELTNTNR